MDLAMATKLKIVGIGGSLDSDSASLAALRIALDGARSAGAEVAVFDIPQLDLPIFRTDYKSPPPDAARLADAVYEADGLIWSSPLYHGTVSGAFKNALDWLELLSDREPKYLTDKVVGLIATAGGTQGLQAINTMEFVVRALRGWTVPLVAPIARAGRAFAEDGSAIDPAVDKLLRSLGEETARAAAAFQALRAPLAGAEA
jgi:FMN reductase